MNSDNDVSQKSGSTHSMNDEDHVQRNISESADNIAVDERSP